MSGERFLDKAFWSLTAGICSFGVYYLQEMSKSVHTLNQTMAVIITRMEVSEERIFNLEKGDIFHAGKAKKPRN